MCTIFHAVLGKVAIACVCVCVLFCSFCYYYSFALVFVPMNDLLANCEAGHKRDGIEIKRKREREREDAQHQIRFINVNRVKSLIEIRNIVVISLYLMLSAHTCCVHEQCA